MHLSWPELLAFLFLAMSGYSLWVFLRRLGDMKELSQEYVDVSTSETAPQIRHVGDAQYESTATHIRMTKWDALPAQEKLRYRRSVELWSLAVGIFFLGALITGFIAFWGLSYYPPSHWLNRPIF